MTWRDTSSLGAAIVFSLTTTLTAQTPRPAFEVASVKRNASGAPGAGGPTETTAIRPGGAFIAVNTTLQTLIRSAHSTADTDQLREDQLIGGPSWIRSERFDINARAFSESSRAEIYLMVQTLLEERFALKVRREQRERDTYVLKLARKDGRLGPDLRKASDDCHANRANRPKDPRVLVTLFPRPSSGARPSQSSICTTIAGLANGLERTVTTTVIDETGLTGMWDYVIAHSGLQPRTAIAASGGSLDERPSFFLAVEEQLGLKLERRKGPVDVLVVESVAQPTEN